MATPNNASSQQPQNDPADNLPISSAMGGADEGNSGGGNASGIPDGETAMGRGGEATLRGDVQEDREKLFPQAKSHRN